MYKVQTTPFVEIITDTLAVGNYKYGRISNAYEDGIFGKEQLKFRIQVERKSEKEIDLESKKAGRLGFYNYYGRFDKTHLTYERPFKYFEDAILEVDDVFSDSIKVGYTEKFRKWTLSRFSKMNTIGEYLTDITTIRLLKDKVLSFHGAAFNYQNKGYILTAFPDTGKSYTVLELLDNDSVNFVAEDILLIDENVKMYSVPYTQTIEKRKDLSGIQGVRCKLHNYLYKDNCIKSDVFEALHLDKKRVSLENDLDVIFFLKRGKERVRRLENTEDNYRLLRDLNNLEFSYWRNELLLTYLFFQEHMTIYDFIDIEKKLIKKLAENVEVVEVTAERHDQYSGLIKKFLEERK